MIHLYGLKRCDTCKKALEWLAQAGVEHDFTDYREHPLDGPRLLAYARELGGWEKLVNRASTTWRNLNPSEKEPATDEQWLALIAAYPTLVRRPLTVYEDESVSVGFSEARFQQKLGPRSSNGLCQ